MSAPSSPLTYQQATAAAAAIHAAGGAQPDPVTTLAAMSQQIAGARERSAAWAKAAIQRMWASVNPYDEAQVLDFATKAADLMASAQSAAARVAAAGQSQQLLAVGIRVTAAAVAPVDIRAPGVVVKNGVLQLRRHGTTVDYAGDANAEVSVKDMTTRSVFMRPAQAFRYTKSVGGTDPGQQARDRIDSLIDDNLMLAQRFAQQQVLSSAVNLDTGRTRSGPRLIGMRRVIHPEMSRSGTCGMCIAASDRLYHVGKLLPIHKGCHCTIAGVTEEHDPADDLNAVDLGQLYKAAGGTTAAHLKRTRYQVDEHGELGPVLVPAKPYKPRGKKRAD